MLHCILPLPIPVFFPTHKDKKHFSWTKSGFRYNKWKEKNLRILLLRVPATCMGKCNNIHAHMHSNPKPQTCNYIGSIISFVSSPPLFTLISHYSFWPTQWFNVTAQLDCYIRLDQEPENASNSKLANTGFVFPRKHSQVLSGTTIKRKKN